MYFCFFVPGAAMVLFPEDVSWSFFLGAGFLALGGIMYGHVGGTSASSAFHYVLVLMSLVTSALFFVPEGVSQLPRLFALCGVALHGEWFILAGVALHAGLAQIEAPSVYLDFGLLLTFDALAVLGALWVKQRRAAASKV